MNNFYERAYALRKLIQEDGYNHFKLATLSQIVAAVFENNDTIPYEIQIQYPCSLFPQDSTTIIQDIFKRLSIKSVAIGGGILWTNRVQFCDESAIYCIKFSTTPE